MNNPISREACEKLNKETLIEILLMMQTNFDEVKKQNEALTMQLNDLNANFKVLLEKFNVAQNARFGKSSEKMDFTEEELADIKKTIAESPCFNEAENTVDMSDPDELEEPTLEEVGQKKKKKAKGKRSKDLEGLPQAEPIISDLSHDELVEQLGEGYKRMPDDVYRHLEFHPGTFEVQEYHVAVYRSADGERFAHAKRPTADLLQNSLASPSLVAGILNYKYVNAMPIYRLEQNFLRSDVVLSRQVMCNWVIRCSERYLSLIWDRMKEVLLQQEVIQADETTLKVSKDGRAAGAKSFMWVYSSSELDQSGKRIVLFEYHKTRETVHLEQFLEGYSGIVVSDGYESYHKLEREKEGIIVAGCYAHARRRFVNAIKAMRKTSSRDEIKETLAYKALKQMAAIYTIDKSLKELSAEERLERRNLSVTPLVEAFRLGAKNKDKVPPKSETGQGFGYCLNQEKYLKTFLTNGNVPIDNSSSERNIRPFTIGRKNWVLIDTIAGAEASAISYSIAETAKANNLRTYEYYKYLLTEIPKYQDETDLAVFDQLLPWSASLPEYIRRKK
ncbi:transposase [Petrocella atlantisensis]|uniref:Transposase n=1 Tax=Petrocella atlantisensis TaxID=2173034 RepID=A0A3P7S2T7_9FIRM|nr:IS66 family transposase [Petrocella atlantisensis]VDN49146.1 transposase [Petrocella atlantisensis]